MTTSTITGGPVCPQCNNDSDEFEPVTDAEYLSDGYTVVCGVCGWKL